MELMRKRETITLLEVLLLGSVCQTFLASIVIQGKSKTKVELGS